MRFPELPSPAPKESDPKAPWLRKLENIVKDGVGAEIQNEGRDIIIQKLRYKSIYGDWKIEIKHPEGSPLMTEIYGLKNEMGLIRGQLRYNTRNFPNTAGINSDLLYKLHPDGSDYVVDIEEPEDMAERVDLNFRADELITRIEKDYWNTEKTWRTKTPRQDDLKAI